MNKLDRDLHKQLLLMKGDALRTQLMLETRRWRQPSHLLQESAGLLGATAGSGLLGSALLLLRQGRARRWLKVALAAASVARILRR